MPIEGDVGEFCIIDDGEGTVSVSYHRCQMSDARRVNSGGGTFMLTFEDAILNLRISFSPLGDSNSSSSTKDSLKINSRAVVSAS